MLLLASTPPSLSSSFYDGVEEGAILYVPARKGSAYKSSSWGTYFTNIVEMDYNYGYADIK